MTLPAMHPYAGRATTLTRAMSTTDSPGATPHTEGHPWAEEDVEASRQILRRRLAKKRDRLEERAETVSAQRLRIQELEAEVERLRKALEQISRQDTPSLAIAKAALDGAEDGQHE